MNDLATRVLSGVVLSAVFLGAAIAGGWLFVLLATIIASILWAEWVDMKLTGCDDRLQMAGIGIMIVLGLAVMALPAAALPLSIIVILLGFVVLSFGLRDQRALGGFLYAALFLISLALMRGDWGYHAGLVAILFLVAVVWATDIGAYFVGRAVGGPKLAPGISPNKTISGALGGLMSAIAASLLVSLMFGAPSPLTSILLGAFLSVLTQLGDLFESWMKRRAGVKDSGTMIPGHGGMMDRVDGLVFAAIGLWVASAWQAGVAEPARAFFA